ncbi:DUF6119 family protein [Streptomyces sp. NPDC051921]|uniref:DUF6119 family protein n=1 Tax=Streptomyces sp. NPDC051921 TaxID=3155806 RepID=UPI00343CDD11
MLVVKPSNPTKGGKVSGSPKLRFNCFLLREGLTSFQEALRTPYREFGISELTEVPAAANAPEGCRAFLGTKSDNVPPWARSLTPIFPDLEAVTSISHRLVIFLPVKERVFAVCFGYGSSTLEWSWIEPNFGLRFAARSYDTDALNEIRSRRIDPSARTQSVSIPNRTGLRDFDVELDGEFVRRMVGELDEGLDFPDLGAVVATDSVAFKVETDLNKVHDILQRMLTSVDNSEIKGDLQFIDALEPLRSNSDLTEELERLLVRELFQERASARSRPRDEDVASLDPYILSFAPPDDLTIENVHEIRLKRGDELGSLYDMSTTSLIQALADFRGSFGRTALKEIKVTAVDSEGNPASQSTPLKNWLIFEAGSDDRRYLLTLGKWFALAEDYAKQLDEDISKLDDVTDLLDLGVWTIGLNSEGKKYEEKDFNKAAADGRGDIVCLDRDTIASAGGEIEACDLLHSDGYLIHVKKYTDSQTLSHLFSQGYVAAQVLTEDQDYRLEFIEKVRALNPAMEEVARKAPTRVTYAIAVKGNRDISRSLPTFSKVNLRGFARKLQRMQVYPSLARVQMVEQDDLSTT